MSQLEESERAYRSAIRSQILRILEHAAAAYAAQGDPDSDLRDAPEYFLNVNLAQGLATAFPSLRYRLEHHASKYEDVSRSTIDARVAIGRDSGRFDIVLLNRDNNVPRYIIEVKRGLKIVDDARRIMAMAALDSGRRRWRHGFLVTVIRRSESEAQLVTDQLTAKIKALRETASSLLEEHQTVKVTKVLRRIGHSRVNSEVTSIYGVVFQIALVGRSTSEPEADDE